MTTIKLVIVELFMIAGVILLICGVMRHACDERRDRRLYVGRHHLAGVAR